MATSPVATPEAGDLPASGVGEKDDQARRERQEAFTQAMSKAHPQVAEPDAGENTIEGIPARRRSRYEEIDPAEMLDAAKRLRDRDRDEIGLSREGLLQETQREEFRIRDLDRQGRELDRSNDQAERAGDPDDDTRQKAVELEKNRQIQMLQTLHTEYRVDGNNFYFKDQAGNKGKLAFRSENNRLKTATNDPRVARSMAAAAYANGWTTLRVNGHEDFKREVWFEASLRGMTVEGYSPKPEEVRELEAARERQMRNSIEATGAGRERPQEASERPMEAPAAASPAPERTRSAGVQRTYTGILVEHGRAPFNHDPEEKQSYYVKLATAAGIRTVWGKDLDRAMTDSRAQAGDAVRLDHRGDKAVTVEALRRDDQGKVIGTQSVDAKRNAWEVKLSDRARVIEAVANAVVTDKFNDPQDRKAVLALMDAKIRERDAAGKLPTPRMYDPGAASQSRDNERARPAVERNAERTR